MVDAPPNKPGSVVSFPTNRRVAKVAFTGSTATGRLIMQYASENIVPMTLELGGKSPNIFLPDVMAEDDAFLDPRLHRHR